MSKSTVTDKALAESLKKLMHHQPINRIRVKMIVEDCGLARHTFYNHFKDVYDLLGWIYEYEVIEDLEKYCNLAQWKEGLLLVLNYTVKNRTICLNTYHSLGRDHLETFINNVFKHVITGIIEDITQNLQVSDIVKKEATEFYASASMGIFIAWLKQDLQKDPDLIADWIEKLMEGNIVRLMNQYAEP